MSMVLAVFDNTRAAIASDGQAVQYNGETPFVTRTDCRKIYRVRSGQLVGRVGQSVLCSQLDSILRHFSGSFESCCDVVRQFLKDCQPFKGEKPLGALSLIIIGHDSEGRVVAFESGRAFDDSITENVYRCDPGIRGFLAAGLTKNATELDAIVEGLPDASDFAKFLQTGLQQINAAHPIEVGGDFFAEELDGASYQVMDGPTFKRVLHVDADNTFHVSSSLNNQGSIVGSPAASPSYTSTTTSISWSWGAFTAYFPDGSTLAVSSGSQNFTGLTANTTYYFEFYVVKSTATMTCVMSDNTTAPASVQFLAQTVGADGHLIEVTDITAATPSSGTGGGSGGGGTCFSGDTRIKTDLGFVRMDELPAEFNIVNQTGIHHALRIVHTYRDDQLLVMPDNGLVTAGHMMQKGESWVPASELFSEKAPAGTRTLYDIQVVTGKPEDMHYILENGYVAHNKSRVSCFDGEARVLTTEGWIRFKNLPEKFQIVNSKGIFDGRLFQHQSSRTNPPRMRSLPEGGTVTDDHIVRPLGEADWRHAEELLPASTNFPEVVYNIISDGGYYRVGNLEARALEGND